MLSLLASSALLLGPWLAQEPTGSEPAQSPEAAPAAVAPAAQDPAPGRSLDLLFDGSLVGAKDGEGFAETPGYRRLLEILSSYGEDELRQKSTRALDVQAALADPAAWRGEIVRVRALLAERKTVRLSRPLGEHVDTYRAFLINDKGKDSEGIVVDFLEEPPELEPRRDVVDVEGVFFRTLRFENVLGEMRDVPYLIARGVRRFEQEGAPRNTTLDGVALIAVGAAVAYIVARVLMSMRPEKRRPGTSQDTSIAIRQRARVPLRPHPPAKNP